MCWEDEVISPVLQLLSAHIELWMPDSHFPQRLAHHLFYSAEKYLPSTLPEPDTNKASALGAELFAD